MNISFQIPETPEVENSVYTFAEDSRRDNKILPSRSTLRLNSETEDKTCRICLECNRLDYIRPCKCSGTIKHVHEECLKT